jgi:hypothetical protein
MGVRRGPTSKEGKEKEITREEWAREEEERVGERADCTRC